MQRIQYYERYPSDEKGIVLVLTLLLMATLALFGSMAVISTATDIRISANNRTANRAFFAGESGIEEARARLRGSSTTNPNFINDAHPTDSTWSAFIGSETKSQGKGYNSANSMHVRVASLQSALDYTVRIVHSTDASGNVLYWDGSTRTTTPGQNIYRVTSFGGDSGASKTIVTEMHRPLPIQMPAALYVEAPTTIQGTSTHVNGTDQCGGTSLPGIVTTLATSTVTKNGNPVIKGSTSPTGTPPSIVSTSNDLDVQGMIDNLKGQANYTYNVAGATHTGMNWGTPVMNPLGQDYPSTCSAHNIVYYNTSNGTNLTDIRLSGGSMGCGILLVDGDFEASGDFFWHGAVIVSGSVRITGGGNKNITGGIVAGGSADADLVGGNVSVVYCSSAIRDQTASFPLRNLNWAESTM